MSSHPQRSPSPALSDSWSDDENDTKYGTTETKNTGEATDTDYVDEEDQQSDPGSGDESHDDQENSGSDDGNDESRMTRDSAGFQRFRYKNEEGGYSYTYNEWNTGDRTPSGADQSLSPHRGADSWKRGSEEGPEWLNGENDSD